MALNFIKKQRDFDQPHGRIDRALSLCPVIFYIADIKPARAISGNLIHSARKSDPTIFSDFVQSLSFPPYIPTFSLAGPHGIGNNTRAIYIRVEIRLSRNFISRCSTRSKCKLSSPLATAGTASVLPARAARRVMHMHSRFLAAIWIYGSIEEDRRSIQTSVPPVGAIVPRFFTCEFLACLRAVRRFLYLFYVWIAFPSRFFSFAALQRVDRGAP